MQHSSELDSFDDAYNNLQEAMGLTAGATAKLDIQMSPAQQENLQLLLCKRSTLIIRRHSFQLTHYIPQVKANAGTRRVTKAIECGEKFIQLTSSSRRDDDRTDVARRLTDLQTSIGAVRLFVCYMTPFVDKVSYKVSCFPSLARNSYQRANLY